MDIYKEWKNGRLPIINGILFESGAIDWIRIRFDSAFHRVIDGVSRISISDIMSSGDINFSTISTCYQISDSKNNVRAYCGGGSYGSEGYVVVESEIDSELLWIAFFEEANPFERIEISDDNISVYNNLRERWTFDINNPANLSISLQVTNTNDL